jgi:hypothetical protein
LENEINTEFKVETFLTKKIKASTYINNEEADLIEDVTKLLIDKKVISFCQQKYSKREEYLKRIG